MFAFQIEDGDIYASINQKDGMVRFQDSPEKYNNAAMLLQVDQEVRGMCEATISLVREYYTIPWLGGMNRLSLLREWCNFQFREYFILWLETVIDTNFKTY